MQKWFLFLFVLSMLVVAGCDNIEVPDPNILRIAALEAEVHSIEKVNTIMSFVLFVLGISFAGLAACALNKKTGGGDGKQ